MVSRRAALHLFGAGVFGLAGCGARERYDGSTGSPTAGPTGAPTPTETPTETEVETATESPDPSEEVDIEGESPTWTRALGAPVRAPPVYADGHVVVAAGGTVYGLDAGSGETAWTLDSPTVVEADVGRHDATFRVHDETVYAILGADYLLNGRDYTLFALRPDGSERWRYSSDVERYHEFVGFGDDSVVLATHDDDFMPYEETAIAVGLEDGEERWRADTGDAHRGAVRGSVAIIEAGHSVLDTFDLESGDRRFRFEPGDNAWIKASAVSENRVFAAFNRAGDGSRVLFGLSAHDGTEEWTFDGERVSSLRYFDDLYVGGETVRRLAGDGTERWRYEAGGDLRGVPFDDDVFYTNADSRVVAIRRRDGEERWTKEATDEAIPRTRNDAAIVSLDRGHQLVLAHARDDGEELWQARFSDSPGPEPAAGEDGAFLATDAGSVLKIPT